MNRWIIATAALGALAMPVWGQNAENANRDGARLDGAQRAAPNATAAGLPAAKDKVSVQEAAAPGHDGLVVGEAARVVLDGAPAAVWGKKEKITYLGVVTSSPSGAVREQLKLPRGVGLVVDSVELKTAAEAAGIKPHDIIEKLNDQLLINSEQLQALLRSMKAGDEVALSIVRQGERQAIKAKLSEKEIETGGNVVIQAMDRAAVPPTPVDFTRAITLPRPPDNDGLIFWNPATTGAMDVGGGMLAAGNVIVRQIDGKQTTQWADDQVQISIERDGDTTTKVTVLDAKTGKVIMAGAPPAADDPILKTVPRLREKIKSAIDAAGARPTILLTGAAGGGAVGARGRVARWQDADHVLIMRVIGTKPIYLLALSKKDGRTLYDGPVMTDEQRKSIPAEISEQFEMLAAHPESAKEFGAAEAQK